MIDKNNIGKIDFDIAVLEALVNNLDGLPILFKGNLIGSLMANFCQEDLSLDLDVNIKPNITLQYKILPRE